MRKYLLIILGLFLIAALSSDDIEKRIQKIENTIEVIKQHFKTKKVTADEVVTDYGFFHDRGDPAAYDQTADTILLNSFGAWHDWDLSSIVPAGAKAVSLMIIIENTAAEKRIQIRENGNSNTRNRSVIYSQVADVLTASDITVACDTDRVIEYLVDDSTWTTIGIVVKGWFK